MRRINTAIIAIVFAICLTACGEKNAADTETSVQSDNTVAIQTTTSEDENKEDDYEGNEDEESFTPLSDEEIAAVRANPVNEVILEPVAWTDEQFAAGNLSFLSSAAVRSLMDCDMIYTYGREESASTHFFAVYDDDTNEYFIQNEDDLFILCDGNDVYAVATDSKKYVKHSGIDRHYLDNIVGGRAEDVIADFNHDGYKIQYGDEILYRFEMILDDEALDAFNVYYYFDEKGTLKYSAEAYSTGMVSLITMNELTDQFDNKAYFTLSDDYSEVSEEEKVDSLMQQWTLGY